MIIIPAIDIRGGNCVRLKQGKLSEETVYSQDPVFMAKQFAAQGAERIHVVDLDGAFSGKMKNGEIISAIAAAVEVPVQVGGGIREYSLVKELLCAGVERVIMGSAAIYDRKLLGKVLKKWPSRLSVGIDSSSGKVAIGGWKDITAKWATTLAAEMQKEGVQEIIITDIKKDGTLRGPNLKWIKKIASGVNISVIASGGVSNIEDIMAIKNLGQDNISAVIVGKALYRDDFSLPAAIKEAK